MANGNIVLNVVLILFFAIITTIAAPGGGSWHHAHRVHHPINLLTTKIPDGILPDQAGDHTKRSITAGIIYNNCPFTVFARSAKSLEAETVITPVPQNGHYWSVYSAVSGDYGVVIKIGMTPVPQDPVYQLEWAVNNVGTIYYDFSHEDGHLFSNQKRFVQLGDNRDSCAVYMAPGDESNDWPAQWTCPTDTVKWYLC